MNEFITQIDPKRWKASLILPFSSHRPQIRSCILAALQVFQVLLLDSENTGAESGSIRDARDLAITSEQFAAFVRRHKDQAALILEDNSCMRDSYLNLDEKMR
jgi:hypothetical protein